MIPCDSTLFFRGRPGDPRLGEWATPCSMPLPFAKADRKTMILFGCPDDTGVTRNRGRAGARGGPEGIRGAFYKIAWPMNPTFEKTLKLYDAGNIVPSESILTSHDQAFRAAKSSAATGATVIALGGGHDFAAPHFLGFAAGLPKKSKIGLINVDPHLDVREFEDGLPHSGTPFRQILESRVLVGKSLVEFGARDGRNARSHFEYCAKEKVDVCLFEDIRTKGDAIKQFKAKLDRLAKAHDHLALTIDMDACSELEGVSAAPVIGFSAWELTRFAFHAGQNTKVGLFELAEVAPSLDPTGRSARIAAEVLFAFMQGRLAGSKAKK